MQTLIPLPVLVRPITLAQSKTVSANLAAIQNLDNRATIALSVLGAIYELQGNGGFDYRTNKKQLRVDAQSLLGVYNTNTYLEGQSAKLRAVFDWNDGYKANNTLGTDVNALVVLMGSLRENPEYILELQYYFLQYQLGE